MAALSVVGSFLVLGAAHISSLILGRSDVTQGAERRGEPIGVRSVVGNDAWHDYR
jgi:hypothetical protein